MQISTHLKLIDFLVGDGPLQEGGKKTIQHVPLFEIKKKKKKKKGRKKKEDEEEEKKEEEEEGEEEVKLLKMVANLSIDL